MIFAFFTACLISNATGAVECANSYTEMSSVIRDGESCELVAHKLQEDSINSILIVRPDVRAMYQRTRCGTLAQVKEEAESLHFAYVANGIESTLFEF